MAMSQAVEPLWVETMPRPVRRMVEQIPKDEVLSGAGLRAARDSLGLSAKDLANAVGASVRMVQIWETQDHVPAWVYGEILFLFEVTDQWVERLRQTSGTVAIHRDGWRIVEDNRILPENWWRVIVGRVIGNDGAGDVQWDMSDK